VIRVAALASWAALAVGLTWVACDDSGTVVGEALGVRRVGPPTKLFQILGDVDREGPTPQPTFLRTQSTVGILGADLGFSFLHQGRLYFYFGDTDTPDFDLARPRDADSIAYAEVPAPGAPLELQFLVDADGRWHAVTLDGVPQGSNEVPVSGFSDGQNLWAFYYVHPTERGGGGGYVRLARSTDGAFSFETVLRLPPEMQFVMPRVVATSSVQGLGASWPDAQTLLAWSRSGVQPPVVAAAPLGRVADASAWRYRVSDGSWAPEMPTSPAFVYPPPTDYNCRGPFSVFPVDAMGRWLMLERCAGVPGVSDDTLQMRVATDALGPWVGPIVLFDPTTDGAIGTFMHQACDPNAAAGPAACIDTDYTPKTCCAATNGEFGYVLDDGGNSAPAGDAGTVVGMGPEQSSWPYAPFPIEPLTQWDPSSSTTTVTFLMSTLNPYTVMMMQVALARDP
jgi:hypothetical protein